MLSHILQSLFTSPSEICDMMAMKCKGKLDLSGAPEHTVQAYHHLNEVSRSFAMVVTGLHPLLRDAVCNFYLVLRGLDTIEDDVSIEFETKAKLLRDFKNNLTNLDYSSSFGEEEKERKLLENFQCVVQQFLGLENQYQKIIVDCTERMAEGMVKYQKEDVESLEDWDEYCYYVAGIVGEGLTQMFIASGLEDSKTFAEHEGIIPMALNLQKVNIIRDYREDVEELNPPRVFWPSAVWKKHGDNIKDFLKPENMDKALACNRELTANALGSFPSAMKYLYDIEDQSVLEFCAIPQIMAIATLAECYNNPEVFSGRKSTCCTKSNGVVKIRKGTTCALIMRAKTKVHISQIMWDYAIKIKKTAAKIGDTETKAAAEDILDLVGPNIYNAEQNVILQRQAFVAVISILAIAYLQIIGYFAA